MAEDNAGATTVAAPMKADPSAIEAAPAKAKISNTVAALGATLSLSNHPKSSAAAYAAVVTPLIITGARHFFGWDLSGQEANVTAAVMLLAALIAPNA